MSDSFAVFAAARSSEERPDRPHLWPAIFITMILLGIAVVVMGSSSTPPESGVVESSAPSEYESRVYTITYRYGVFSPTNLRIHVGDTVRWKNDHLTPLRVAAQLQPGETVPRFTSSGSIQPSSYFSYTFAQAGVFGYSNQSNSNEAGVVIVRER